MTDDQIIEAIERWRCENGWSVPVMSHELDIDPEIYKACRDTRPLPLRYKHAWAWNDLRKSWITEIKESAQRNGVPGLFD